MRLPEEAAHRAAISGGYTGNRQEFHPPDRSSSAHILDAALLQFGIDPGAVVASRPDRFHLGGFGVMLLLGPGVDRLRIRERDAEEAVVVAEHQIAGSDDH